MKLRTAVLAIISTALALFSSSRSAHAQAIQLIDDGKLPRFDVVSVKPGDPSSDAGRFGSPTGFAQENLPLWTAVLAAFSLRPDQLGAAPDFINSERFTISARMPAGAPRSDLPLMLRALLIDRFKLRYHVESTEQDGYTLTLARQDGRLGPKMRASHVDCATRLRALAQKETVEPLPPAAAECGVRNGPGRLEFGGMPMPTFVQMLSAQIAAPVVDQTGLNGAFDVELHFALPSGPRGDRQPPVTADAPSIFTAVQEQLGLKLTRSKARVDRLVIDHIERPDVD